MDGRVDFMYRIQVWNSWEGIIVVVVVVVVVIYIRAFHKNK